MFNDYQIMLLALEREHRLSRELQNRKWLYAAQEAKKGARQEHNSPAMPTQGNLSSVILRTLAVAMLIVLLAIGLTRLASA